MSALKVSVDLPKVSVENVSPCVKTFLTGLTAEQWSLLETGTPDDSTRLRLADMLLNVFRCVVGVLSDSLQKGVSVDNVRDSLEDSIERSFAEAVGVEVVNGPGSDTVTEWIATEVVALASSERPAQPKPTNSLIRSVCRMLKRCAGKMKRCCGGKQSRYSSIQTSPNQTNKDSDAPSSIKQVVQEVISEELNQIIEPFVEEVEDVTYNQLQEQLYNETDAAAEDIAQSVTEYIGSKESKESGFFIPSPKAQQQKNLKGVRNKIGNFFAKMFAKASICRIFSQVKTKFSDEAKVDDDESVKSLLEDAEPLLNTIGKTQVTDEEVSLLRRLEKISRDDVLELTGELSDVLYGHITGEMAPEAFREDVPGTSSSEAQPYARMYADIRQRVICFLSLMNWWLENQVARYSDRVLLALMENETVTTAQVIEGPREEVIPLPTYTEAEQEDAAQTCLKLVITTLIKKARKAVQGDRAFFTDLETTIQRLVDDTWAELNGTNVNITPRNAENLAKAIFKDLRRKWSSAVGVLVAVETRDKNLPQCIAASCKAHLLKQRSSFFSIFSQ